ncbi:hypothetical protein M440DRAFT_1465279 [Trichoderma longibrachiatum ATCC 18648]|uniref:Uncharacterized protein n=1 Tax=Trichoderma longibrachiatum ATCC 18648 TaxID=983965 RepID=A0A2T4BVF4_TRILO|nr:hypothetical protein M440DRAFT_1465279 [Trichoderma longibrachiatum ATCC 18648]
MASHTPETPPTCVSHKPAAQKGPNPTVPNADEAPEFMNTVSAWNSVLMKINNTMLGGFAHLHIARIGKSVFPVRNGDDIQDFAILTLPMGQTEKPMNAECFRTNERSDIPRMFPEPPGDPAGVSYSRYRSQDLLHFRGMDISKPAWNLIFNSAQYVVQLESVIDVRKVAVSYPAKFWDKLVNQPAGLRFIAERLKSAFDKRNRDEQVFIQFLFPYVEGWERDWYVFFDDERKINPGVLDLQARCNNRIEDLDYSKALIGHRWLDEELLWKQLMARNCGKTYFQARLLPFPGSEWIPTTSDVAEYGMNGTGRPTAYLMAVNLSYVREFLPDIGTKSTVYIRELAQHGYTMPRPPLADSHVKQLARRLQRTFFLAEAWAIQRFRGRGRTSMDEEDVKRIFLQCVAMDVALFLPVPSADDPRNTTNSQAAEHLRKRQGEDDDDHYRRILLWIREALRIAPKTRYHEPCTGIRLNLPPGISADVALFFVEVPRQRDWPCNMRKPPMVIDAPKMPPVTDLQGFLDTAFTDHRQVLRAEIRYSVKDDWNLKESEVIPIMNNVDLNAEETACVSFNEQRRLRGDGIDGSESLTYGQYDEPFASQPTDTPMAAIVDTLITLQTDVPVSPSGLLLAPLQVQRQACFAEFSSGKPPHHIETVGHMDFS